MLLVLMLSSSAFAQGSIYGTVTNSDVSTPANGEIAFVGFLDDADEEIRIETSDGAGYDAGHWFDDFQNYLTEAAGNPYDYHIYNTANGEGFVLSGTIPSNSFQEENVVLAAVAWPAVPTGLSGTAISGSTVVLSWDAAGVPVHVYRRLASSNGSFFRIDDPAGSLANFGVVENFFVDATVDGSSTYEYLLIADDGSGILSPHSAAVAVSSIGVSAPILATFDPDNGTATGGTVIDVQGSGFDPAGAQVMFGATPVDAVVVSPFQLTVTSPAGTVGASVDISVVNTASALTSNVLTGGFTYAANAAPELAAIGAQSTTENVLLEFATSASDIDGGTPVLTSTALPGTATYVDNGDGTGNFSWTPLFTDAGVYDVTFYATDDIDGLLVDSEVVQITVIEAGNQPPVLALINDTTVAEGGSLALTISVSDLDGEIPGLSADGLPTNATFVDNGDGTGAFAFDPALDQAGVYPVTFIAVDASFDADSITVQITVTDENQLPVLAAIGAQTGDENILLSFGVSASDGDGTTPALTTSALPGTAVFTDNGDGTGSFDWTPTFADSGSYSVTFYATDAVYSAAIDSEIVVITINDAGNQAPVIAEITTPQAVAEGGNLNFVVTATDVDATIPVLTAEGLPTNATFVDNTDGTGTFDFNPDFNQAGAYSVTFIADDGTAADSQVVEINVTDGGNVPPAIDSLGDFAVDEGASLNLTINASDPDGGGAFPLLSVNTSLANYTFTDNGDGTGTLAYTPDFYDAGVDTVVFFATDGGTPQQTVSSSSVITTTDINQQPVFVAAGPYSAVVGELLEFTVTATDSTDPNTEHRLYLSVVGLPTNATFTDNGDGTGTFGFTPDVTQVGTIPVSFLAADQGVPQASATMGVDIDVVAENIAPVIDPIDPQIVAEGVSMALDVSASDADGTIPALSISDEPDGATFVDNGDGTGVFSYTPIYVGGTRIEGFVLRASDGITIVRRNVLIQITDAGNQAPVFAALPAPIPPVTEGTSTELLVEASDPDGGSIILALDEATAPANVTFVDSANGIGLITFSPDFTQAGTVDVSVIAYDGPIDDENTLSTIQIASFTVEEAGNQDPVLAAIGARSVSENGTLAFSVSATDPDGTSPTLTTSALPANATFTDNADGTGSFSFTPDLTQAGMYDITFTADDGVVQVSELVTITVTDVNQLPFVFTSGGRTVNEGESLVYEVTSFDADGTTPYLSAVIVTTEALADNMSFADNRDGTGTLTFTPDYTQGGPASNPRVYSVVFTATDEDYASVSQTSETVALEVVDVNQPPILFFASGEGPFSLNEGETLAFQVAATDPDGSLPPSLTALNLPDSNVSFNVSAGTGDFQFNPDFTQAGNYSVSFIAVDQHAAADTQIVDIEVLDAGNQPPGFDNEMLDTLHVPVGKEFEIAVSLTDPDQDSVVIEAFPILPGATWQDNGNGTGVYTFRAESEYLDSVLQVTFVATDYPSMASATMVTHSVVVSYLRGDLDNSADYTINDVAFLIGYLFRNGPAPEIPDAADVDGDGMVNVGDVSYLIYYMWYYGPQPPR